VLKTHEALERQESEEVPAPVVDFASPNGTHFVIIAHDGYMKHDCGSRRICMLNNPAFEFSKEYRKPWMQRNLRNFTRDVLRVHVQRPGWRLSGSTAKGLIWKPCQFMRASNNSRQRRKMRRGKNCKPRVQDSQGERT